MIQHPANDKDRFMRPLAGACNPSSTGQGTTPGSFARPSDIGGPLMSQGRAIRRPPVKARRPEASPGPPTSAGR